MLINLFESFVKGQFYDKDIIFGINFTKRMELCNAIDIIIMVLTGNILSRHPISQDRSSLSSKPSRKFYINI